MDCLKRFLAAQDATHDGFAAALAEMRRGRKSSHWIWYIFPQVDGLGRSAIARNYAIGSVDEAEAYLRHPILGARLAQITAVAATQLAAGVPLETLMGGHTDALKLVSSMTLFAALAGNLAEETPESPMLADLARDCQTVLESAARQGFPPCQATESFLRESR